MTNVRLNDLVHSNNPSSTDNSTPQIYVAVAAYHHEKFHGRWMEVPQEMESIQHEVLKRLSDDPIIGTDTFIIHDSEDLGSLEVKHFENIDVLQEKIMFLLDLDELGIQLLVYFHGDINNATEAVKNRYCGAYESALAYTIHFVDTHYLGAASEKVKDFVDYEMFKEAIFSHDYFSLEAEGKCHVFSRR